jgi:hypothetical protein
LTTLDARRMPTPRLPGRDDIWTPDDARQILDVCAASGDPLAVCARRLGVTPSRLYWWKARLAAAATAPLPTSLPNALSLVPATVMSVEASAAITIRLPNGIAVEVSAESCTPSLVAAIVTELSKASS